MMLEKTRESALHSKEVKPVNPIESPPEYSWERLMVKLKVQYVGQDLVTDIYQEI